MRTPRRVLDGTVLELTPGAVNLLIQLFSEVIVVLDAPMVSASFFAALGEEPEEKRAAPQDPILARLLPAAAKDPQLAADMRALTEDSLRVEKTDRLAALIEQLRLVHDDELLIRTGEEWEWLAGINDCRLALAGYLQIEDSRDLERLGNALQCREVSRGPQPLDLVETPGAPPVASQRREFLVGLFFCLGQWQDSLLSLVQEGSSER